MPSNEYIRCHYCAPTGIECEIWFLKAGENDVLCPIHKGSTLSVANVSNGNNKQEFYAHRDRVVEPLVTATAGMNDVEALSYIDKHVAELEAKIAELKLEAMHARALAQGRSERLSDDERKARQKIKVESSRPVKVAKKSAGKLSRMSPEGMVQELMKRHGLDESGAKKLLGID